MNLKLAVRAVRTVLAPYYLYANASRRPRILFYGDREMHFNHYKNLALAIANNTNAEVFFCIEGKFERASPEVEKKIVDLGFPKEAIITRRAAKTRVWKAVFALDFTTPNFLHETTKIQIFHGIAAKKCELATPRGTVRYFNSNYHPNLNRYDICFFQNRVFLKHATENHLLKTPESGELVGLSCMQDLFTAEAEAHKLKEKLIPVSARGKQIILLAPSWGTQNSFYHRGLEILDTLSKISNLFTIFKPHPLIHQHGLKGSDSNLKEIFSSRFSAENGTFVEEGIYLCAQLANIIATDYGSFAMEATNLHKPIILFTRENNEEVTADLVQYNKLLQACIEITESKDINEEVFSPPASILAQKEAAMKAFAEDYFANPENASICGVNVLVRRGLLKMKGES